MLRQTRLQGTLTVNIDDFKVTTKLRVRAVKTGGAEQSPRSAKSNKIVRCMGIADRMPATFMRMAEESRKEGNRAKRNAKKYAKRK